MARPASQPTPAAIAAWARYQAALRAYRLAEGQPVTPEPTRQHAPRAVR